MNHLQSNRVRFCILLLSFAVLPLLGGCTATPTDDTLVLRVCNWEEYIDEGDWDAEEVIDLPNGDIIGDNSMIADFEQWYEDTYGQKITVAYSCFGSNEELYNQLTLGDTFDLVCPSEYMIMKLLAEEQLEPYSDTFWDTSVAGNYYSRGVSPYIQEFVQSVTVNGQCIDRYAAGYMWGTTGIVYNPEQIDADEAGSWKLLFDDKYKRQVTMKDNVRDAYFATLSILHADDLLALQAQAGVGSYRGQSASATLSKEDYHNQFTALMNDTSQTTLEQAEQLLAKGKDQFYSFESDSGKADMVTGKVLANYQWSGDGVYTLDQAEEDGIYLEYAVPQESSNLWFDGWVMLKKGIAEDARKKQACEAFVNFISRPDNVVRNMYYIGYTSVIAGNDDSTILDYADWCYGAEDDETDVTDYDVRYFFDDENAIITTPTEQTRRQLFAQYPTEDVLERCSIMEYFGEDATAKLNQMWIDVRCFNPWGG